MVKHLIVPHQSFKFLKRNNLTTKIKEMKKIKSIAEAFSMQPNILTVTTEPQNVLHKEWYIKEIKLETTEMWVDDIQKKYDVYRGYDWNGNISFEYLANTVNVHYIDKP